MGSIGIYDSGVGGFSILGDIVKIFKNQNIFYFADQKNIPYSEKSIVFLKKRAEKITNFLIKEGCSTIVIACNTSTVFSISHLRKKFKNINFVGVEPAIKPAAQQTKSGNILVLATKNTLESNRLVDLKNKYAKNKTFFYKDMPMWVLWAEEAKVKGSGVDKYTTDQLSEFIPKNISSVVLACTHYPFFIDQIKSIFGDVKIFNPSFAVSKQAKKIHKGKPIKNPQISMYTTGNILDLKNSADLLPFSVKIKSISL